MQISPTVIVEEMPGDWFQAYVELPGRTIRVCGPNQFDVKTEASKYIGIPSMLDKARAQYHFQPAPSWGMYR